MVKSEQSAKTQTEQFIETARALGCDEDKERFEVQLGKIAAQKIEKGDAAPKKKRPDKKPSRSI